MESQREPVGNTKSTGKNTAGNQLYKWCFTLKSEDCELSQLLGLLKEICKKFVFQLEKGDSGYEHYQGWMSLKMKERFNTVKNHFPQSIHLEPCKNSFASEKYCSKQESRIDGPWTEESKLVKIIKDLRPWQQGLVDLIKELDERDVVWVYSNKGGAGKSNLAKWLHIKKKALVCTNARTADIVYACKQEPEIIVFDFVKCCEGRINYGAIESVKGGMLFNTKYESGNVCFDPPAIICFANFWPPCGNDDVMMDDRWKFYEVLMPEGLFWIERSVDEVKLYDVCKV